MHTQTKTQKPTFIGRYKAKPRFIAEEVIEGIGRVAIFSDRDEFFPDGFVSVQHPTENYLACSRLIDKIFQEKCPKRGRIDKQNLSKYVA